MEFQEESQGVPLFSPTIKLRTMNRIKRKKRSRQRWIRKHINMLKSSRGILVICAGFWA